MSSTPTPAPSSPASPPTPAPETTPSFLTTAGKAIRDLPLLGKIALIALLLILLVVWYIWMGQVTTEDAQVDPREYKAEADQAKAALDLAEAEAMAAKLQIGLTRGTTTHSTGGAVAQSESDTADYVMAQTQLERAATANLLQAKAEVAAKKATNE